MRYTQSTNIPTYKSSNSLQCRFVDYQPAKISSLAFSHPSNSKQPTPASLLLAVGRSNGDIELWSPLYEWVHKTVPPLSRPAFSNRRLFEAEKDDPSKG